MAESRLARLSRQRNVRSADRENLVVLIDDDLGVLDTLGYVLRKRHIRTLTAPDGMSGLALIRHHHPKVVVLDMYLPHKSGFELISEMRGDPLLRQIAIIAITGMASDAEDLHSMRGDADTILAKPVDEELLVDLVVRAFEATDEKLGLTRTRTIA